MGGNTHMHARKHVHTHKHHLYTLTGKGTDNSLEVVQEIKLREQQGRDVSRHSGRREQTEEEDFWRSVPDLQRWVAGRHVSGRSRSSGEAVGAADLQ